ncbi:Myg1p Ecym_5538 [Eremothecium cymbalariae DBVPG|uniref:Uncharacterized protein n=1 Tax=Eremothecium cymbalariae (strain CBS 270.75 / DBVPG 7215 / KCTC 17166 / NRRL Y-17582) TaxID=931890 RepID=I6NDY6_ERECY|nr:hypothetical protein Ecym_5538 [Eremothecium cymbalariae DBVPG\
MSKRVKMAPINKICTHSGSFHADEALAVYMLRLLPEAKDAVVVRSREPEKWEEADIVVDVSGKYDGIKYFDHHQREFSETFNDVFKTKLSSAGLIYKHFGQEIIRIICPVLSEDSYDILYNKVYKEFIESLDANDNGINNFDAEELGVTRRFSDKNITIPAIISRMNPSWNEDCSPGKFDEQFFKASKFIGECFVNLVESYGKSWLPAKDIVRRAVLNRDTADKSGGSSIIVLDQFCPWKEHLYEVEKELNIENTILFVLFEDSSGSWRVSTVPVSSTSFKFRQGLLEPLRGLRDEELSKKAQVEGCIFVHASGFIGGAKSKEAALQLAYMSLP